MKTKTVLRHYFLIIVMTMLNACEPNTIPSHQTSEVNVTNPTQTFIPDTSPTTIPHIVILTPEINTRLPICTFPLQQTAIVESPPEKYTFDEPKVVFTDELQPEIVDWLPDSQNVIIMPKTLIDLGLNGYEETIELFNPETQETQIYAIRRDGEGMPAWNPELNAIIYPNTKIIVNDTDILKSKFFSQLKISYGNPNATQLLADDLLAHSITVKPDGSQIVYYKNDKELVNKFFSRTIFDGSLQVEKLISVNFVQNEIYSVNTYETVWRLGTSQMFFYSTVSPTDQTILFDINYGQPPCTISFNGWVYYARWSPNGRYLAVIKSASSHNSLWADFNLSVLDGLTGNFYNIDSKKVGPIEMKDCCRHIIGDFSWAPDNRHLIVKGTATFTGSSVPKSVDKLYLVDFISGDVVEIFPSHEFYIGWWGTGLAWSPDGLKLLANCPTEEQGRLCLISVERTIKP
ncbi:MAG: hypothetical protein KF758_09310 [Anaerolineales bacterium]|nr:hypothetical protein [Anaerolineales bacterium]MBX3037100.1 hypothetical protein [Anaerolineales bacterium]